MYFWCSAIPGSSSSIWFQCSILVAVAVAIDTTSGRWCRENETALIHAASAKAVAED